MIAGTGDRAYTPRGQLRRDQMASFLARLLDRTSRDLTPALGDAGGQAVAHRRADAPAPSGRVDALRRFAVRVASAQRD